MGSGVEWCESERAGLVDVGTGLDELADSLDTTDNRGVQQRRIAVRVDLVWVHAVADPRAHGQVVARLGLLGKCALCLGMDAEEDALKGTTRARHKRGESGRLRHGAIVLWQARRLVDSTGGAQLVVCLLGERDVGGIARLGRDYLKDREHF